MITRAAQTDMLNRLVEAPFRLTLPQTYVMAELATSEKGVRPWDHFPSVQLRTMRTLSKRGLIVGAERIQVALTRKGRAAIVTASGSTDWLWYKLPEPPLLTPKTMLNRALPEPKR